MRARGTQGLVAAHQSILHTGGTWAAQSPAQPGCSAGVALHSHCSADCQTLLLSALGVHLLLLPGQNFHCHCCCRCCLMRFCGYCCCCCSGYPSPRLLLQAAGQQHSASRDTAAGAKFHHLARLGLHDSPAQATIYAARKHSDAATAVCRCAQHSSRHRASS